MSLINNFDDEQNKERGNLTRNELSNMLETQVY